MGKKLKKGQKGEATQYLTRSNAIRSLQLTLKDFRRLCILKGVYPREPKKKFKGSDKTYYHIKDLKILQHDELLGKFRDIKAHLKKHKKLLGRKETKLAEQHMQKLPKYSLTSIVKERYPSFQDALKDLDDALCLISLWATFPSHLTLDIHKKDVEMCSKIYEEFMLYCSLTQCFKKAFFSIKGIYYQVEIMGQQITWIAPYQFSQKMPFDIDYKVMGTFLEFYQTMVKFINFKLYSDIGVQYPVDVTELTIQDSMWLDPQVIKKMQKQVMQKFMDHEQANQISAEFQNTPEMIEIQKKEQQIKKQRKLFSSCVFLLGRENPIYALQYLILSFGGNYVLDEQSASSLKKQITHQIIDRPVKGMQLDPKREYVQPQYLIDSLNNLFMLPTSPYKPGISPPPHLSPFVDYTQEGYIPDRQREIAQMKGDELEEVDVLSSEDERQIKQNVEQANQSDSDMEDSSSDDDSDLSVQKEIKKKGKQVTKREALNPKKSGRHTAGKKNDADSSSSGDEDALSAQNDQSEMSEEEQVVQNKKAMNEQLKKDLQKEHQELGKILMTKKQRRILYDHEKNKKQHKDSVKKLVEKKMKIQQRKQKMVQKK